MVVHDFGLVLSGGAVGVARARSCATARPAAACSARYQGLLARFAETETIEELGRRRSRRDAGGDPGPRGGRPLPALARPFARCSTRARCRPARPRTSVDRPSLARLHDPGLGAAVHPAAVRAGAHGARPPAADRAVGAAAVRAVSDRGRRRRPGRPVSASSARRARPTSSTSRCSCCRRCWRPSAGPAAQRFSIDGYASVERRGNLDALLPSELAHDDERVRAQGAVRRSAVLRPRAPERGRRARSTTSWSTAAPRCAARARCSRAGWRWRWPRSCRWWAAERRRLAALLRQPAAPAHRSRAFGAPRSAAPARLPLRARAELRARVRRLAVEVGAAGARTGARGRDHVHHPRRPVRSRSATVKALAARARLYGIFVLPSGPLELDYLPFLHRQPDGDRGVAGARGGEAPARARDRRGRRARHARGGAMATDGADSRPGSSRGAGAAERARAGGAGALPKLLQHDKTDGRRLRGLAGRRGGDLPGARPGARGGLRAAGAAPLRRGAASLPGRRNGRSSGRSARRARAGTARRRGCSPRRATRRWPRSSWRRRARRAAARLEWERVVRDERLAGRPYETALAHLSLGEALLRIGDRAGGAARAGATAARMLEVVADDFETRRRDASARSTVTGSCCSLGKDMGSFENGGRGLPEHDPQHHRHRRPAGGGVLRRLHRLRRRAQGVVRGGDGGARGGRVQPAGSGWPGIGTTSSARPSCGSRRAAREPGGERPDRSVRQRVPVGDRRGDRAGGSGAGGRHLRRAGGAAARRDAAPALPAARAPLRIGAAAAAAGAGVSVGDAPERELQGDLARRPDRVGARRRSGGGDGPADRRRRGPHHLHAAGAARAAQVRGSELFTHEPARARRCGRGGGRRAGARGAARADAAVRARGTRGAHGGRARARARR